MSVPEQLERALDAAHSFRIFAEETALAEERLHREIIQALGRGHIKDALPGSVYVWALTATEGNSTPDEQVLARAVLQYADVQERISRGES